MNLLWDACRSCINIVNKVFENRNLPGWCKAKDWRKKIKKLMHKCGKIKRAGGPHKEDRLKKAVEEFLAKCYELEAKIFQSIKELKNHTLELLESLKLKEFDHFYDMLLKHIDLVDRRLLKGKKSPIMRKYFLCLNLIQSGLIKESFLLP